VQRQHGNIVQIRSRGHGAGNCVRNVVEFQVEEDLVAEARKAVDCAGAFCRVELAADFQKSRRAPQFPRECEGGAQTVVIKSDDYSP
jgi:hypothetical protein